MFSQYIKLFFRLLGTLIIFCLIEVISSGEYVLIIVSFDQDIRAYDQHVVHPFPYPIIADEYRELAARLDMIDETERTNLSHALTVRALYVVGPENTLRLSMVYPVTTGRNIEWVHKPLFYESHKRELRLKLKTFKLFASHCVLSKYLSLWL